MRRAAFLGSADELEQVVVGVHAGSAGVSARRGCEDRGRSGRAEQLRALRQMPGWFAGEPAARRVSRPSRSPWPSAKEPTPPSSRRGRTAKVDALRGYLLPRDLNVTVTRNYGETAKDKSDELLKHLLLATLSVTLLIALALGWRESGVVLIAIPVTLALTLVIFYFFGYTLNRVTLFALIFSIGILVDDAIVVVENIVRHFRLPEESWAASLADVAVEAVDEVGNPTILATFAVIAAILPMAFVRGLMGPYMRPIPVGASAAMLFSLIVAFVVSPWAALRLLVTTPIGAEGHQHEAEGLDDAVLPPPDEPADRKPAGAMDVSRRRGRAAAARLLAGGVQAGASEDAAVRQQERVPGNRRHAERNHAGADHRVAQALGQYLGQQPEVIELPDLCRHLGPLQLQRTGAALLPAAAAPTRRTSRSTC